MYDRVHAIGDSHVLHMGGLFHVHHICDSQGQGATAHNLISDTSRTHSKQKLAAIRDTLDPATDILLLSFGEVDCRKHLRDDAGVAETVGRYTQVINELRTCGYRVIVHAVIGAVPQPQDASQAARGGIVRLFNAALGSWCGAHGVEFLDLDTQDTGGLVHACYCDDGVHLNESALPLYEAWARHANIGGNMQNVVWCLSAMSHFGKIAARALGWPLVVDGPVGDCDTVFVVGMYDAPLYEHTLRMTSRARRRIIQWCGADARVLTRPDLLPEAVHLASFDIYRDRVRAKGVACETLFLPTYFQPELMPMPEVPTITAYLGSNPPAYGSTIVAAVAECMPDVKFKVVTFGTLDEDGMRDLVEATTVSLQAGNLNGGSTTREMMAAGRIALSTIPMPHARLIDGDDFVGIVANLRAALASSAAIEQVAYWREHNSDATFAARIGEILESA